MVREMILPRLLNEGVLSLFALLLIGVALFLTTLDAQYADVGGAGSPIFFPQIILLIWIALAAVAVAQAIIRMPAVSGVSNPARLVIVVVAGTVYANAIITTGFFLASASFALIALPTLGIRGPLNIAAYALLVPGSLVFLFTHALGMPLPTSPFTHWF